MDKEDVVLIYDGTLLSHKKKKTQPFSATWTDLQIIKLSELSQKKKYKYYINITCMQNLKQGTNELIYKTEIESQMQKISLWLGGMDKLGDWDSHIYTAIDKIDD